MGESILLAEPHGPLWAQHCVVSVGLVRWEYLRFSIDNDHPVRPQIVADPDALAREPRLDVIRLALIDGSYPTGDTALLDDLGALGWEFICQSVADVYLGSMVASLLFKRGVRA